jgi:hypothetical protein
MLIREIITETSAGGVATVVMPMNSDIIKRPGPVVKKKKKKKKKAEEGKSPHKKGTKKYKKHMAAMHAG